MLPVYAASNHPNNQYGIHTLCTHIALYGGVAGISTHTHLPTHILYSYLSKYVQGQCIAIGLKNRNSNHSNLPHEVKHEHSSR